MNIRYKNVKPTYVPHPLADHHDPWLRNVVLIARRYATILGLRDIDELVSEGLIGLWKGLQKTNDKIKLRNYIYGAMSNYLRKCQRKRIYTVKLEFDVEDVYQEMFDLSLLDIYGEREKKIVGYLLEGYSHTEISQLLGISTARYYTLLKQLQEKGLPKIED